MDRYSVYSTYTLNRISINQSHTSLNLEREQTLLKYQFQQTGKPSRYGWNGAKLAEQVTDANDTSQLTPVNAFDARQSQARGIVLTLSHTS